MKVKIISFFLLISSLVFSQNVPKYLFINSSPIRAKVIINGKDGELFTPCLVKDIKGVVLPEIILKREGYRDYKIIGMDIKESAAQINMVPVSFDIFFPGKNGFNITGNSVDGPVLLSGVTEGTYAFSFNSRTILLNRTNPFTPAYSGLGVAAGITAATTFSMLGLRFYYDNLALDSQNSITADSIYDYRKYSEYRDGFQNAAIATGIAAGVIVTAIISVIIADAAVRYDKKNKKIESVNTTKTPVDDEDNKFFNTALDFIGAGELEKSIKVFNSMLSLYPDSDYIPRVYYHLGQNYFLLGDKVNALKYMTTFIEKYPLASYYDFVIRNIAEIYYNEKDYENARSWISSVLYQENQLNRESVVGFTAKIDFERYMKNKTQELYQLTEQQLLDIILRFTESDFLDIYYHQLIMLYKSDNNAEKITKLKERLDQTQNINPTMKEIILSYF